MTAVERPFEPNDANAETAPAFSTAGIAAELPLFPLDVVLFPHTSQHLHIFEERYKEMINRCVHQSLPFGIVLLMEGRAEGSGPAVTYSIGCAARIARMERLPDGCMNIEVIGESRFRILHTDESLPYRVGLTVPLQDDPADAAVVVPLADDVQKLLRDFLTRSLAILGEPVGRIDLPDEPEQLSFTAACVLPIENGEKQALLEDTDTASRLQAEKDILLREVTRLRRAAESTGYIWVPVTSERFDDYRCDN